jgi:phosphatidylserine decarboxylase
MSGINNYINSQSFLSCVSTRHVFIINTNDPRVGRVAVIEIGMVEVASCIPLVNVGDEVTKGDQIGRF